MRLKIVLLDGNHDNQIVDSSFFHSNRILDSPIFDLREEKVYGSEVFTQIFDDGPFDFDPIILSKMFYYNHNFIYEGLGEFISIYRFFANPKITQIL